MVPISDKELEYINEYGDEKFEELLEEKILTCLTYIENQYYKK